MSQSEFNVWCKWDPLKKALVGSCVNEKYFEHVANIEIREKLTQMIVETQQDLDYFAQVLQQHGVEVLRPTNDDARLDPNTKSSQVVNIQLQPRDFFFTIGTNLLPIDQDPISLLSRYSKVLPDFNKILQKPCLSFLKMMKQNNWQVPPAPNWTLVGKDLFMDMERTSTGLEPISLRIGDSTRRQIIEWAQEWFPQIDIHWLEIGGHNDGCFHTCKPGAIISLHDIQKYHNTFPNWDILYLPDKRWSAAEGFMQAKKLTKGRYWIPGEEDNKELLTFINTWLDDWVGYVEETVFDVNLLMIDDKTACVSKYNKDVFEFFKKHKIEPIIVPLRHRYFWDSGLHCVSLDLYREGDCQSYINYN